MENVKFLFFLFFCYFRFGVSFPFAVDWVNGTTTQLRLDIDECTVDRNACASNQNCINSPGGFSCECKTGYNLDKALNACVGECRFIPFRSNENDSGVQFILLQISMNVKSIITIVRKRNAAIIQSVHIRAFGCKVVAPVTHWMPRLAIAMVRCHPKIDNNFSCPRSLHFDFVDVSGPTILPEATGAAISSEFFSISEFD